ncbi:hypothetical protein DSM112329_01274 [Paraconexibacter sp. AEG42_29]|uniref:DUF899 domain-containing protein n=1 Tax=Paraconexibacter sp. AEG42_29 TaxID=2997339 RepID=A0AAU7AS24_9ACTN
MTLPEIVSPDEWRAARVTLLEKEKAATRARDELNAERRRLPMVRVEKEYAFDGPDGRVTLLELFGEHPQLMVGHFMFDPDWTDGCPSCTAGADEVSPGLLEHLATRNTAFTYVSRARLETIADYKARRGWTFPWVSSFGSDFNYDFHVTIDDSVTPGEYNYRSAAEHTKRGFDLVTDQPWEMPGMSVFLRSGDEVFHTYSSFARGAEMTGGSYYWLDLTPLGRQEDWEEPKGRSDDVRGNSPDFAR